MNCHNGGRFLKNSVESIINQEYINWELIFFDNQSSDNSMQIIKKFNDSRIKIFKSDKKLTLYHARNEAVKRSSGNLISFLDTDDAWDKSFLKKLLENLTKNDCDLSYSNYYIVDEVKKKKYLNEKSFFLPSGAITQKLISNYKIGVLAVLFKKKLFKNKQFNESYNIIGDFDFFVKSSLIYKFCAVQEPLAFYRIHKQSLSYKKLELHAKEIKNWLEENDSIFRKKYNLDNIKFYLKKLQIKVFIEKIKNFLDR